jgi:hypothetical protein
MDNETHVRRTAEVSRALRAQFNITPVMSRSIQERSPNAIQPSLDVADVSQIDPRRSRNLLGRQTCRAVRRNSIRVFSGIDDRRRC